MTIGFEGNKDEKAFDKYKDKYVTLFTQNNSFSGLITELNKDGFATLNPYLGYNYDKENGAIRALINKPAKIRLIDVIAVEPISKKDLENYCEFTNSHKEATNGKKEIKL